MRRSARRSSARAGAAGPEPRPPATSRNCPPTIPCVPAAVTSSRHGGEHVGRLALLLGEREAERLGEEPVAGEDRHVLAEGHVAGGLAAAQLVVVHRRKVVVDQRVGVDHLDRRGERQHLVGRRGRAPRPWRAPAPGGCACRRRAASSAWPPRGGRCRARRRSAGPRGRRRPSAAARPGRPAASDALKEGAPGPPTRSAPRAARVDLRAEARGDLGAALDEVGGLVGVDRVGAQLVGHGLELLGQRARAVRPAHAASSSRERHPGSRSRSRARPPSRAPSRPPRPRRSPPRRARPGGCAARGRPRAGCCARAARCGRATSPWRGARSTRPARRARASTPSTSSRVKGAGAALDAGRRRGRPVTSAW